MRSFQTNMIDICISHSDVERFVNMAAFHGIILYDMKREDEKIKAGVKADDVLKLLSLRSKTKATVQIVGKKGIYFIWKRVRQMKIRMLCFIMSFVSLYIMSLFVWDIKFMGNNKYTDSYLLNFVYNEGYHPGVLIKAADCDFIEKRLRNEFNDITWVSARLEGTQLVIELEENDTAAIHKDNEKPCSIWASESGKIVRMVTRHGTPIVNIGDDVKKGELLVSGYIPIFNDSQEIISYEETNASADIWINREEKFEFRIPRIQTVRSYKSEQIRPGLILFGRRFCFPGSIKYDKAETYIEQRQWKMFENFYLPIYSETYRMIEYEEAAISYSDEILEKHIKEKYLEFILQLEKIGVEIIENNVTIESDPEKCVMRGTLLLEENVAECGSLESLK